MMMSEATSRWFINGSNEYFIETAQRVKGKKGKSGLGGSMMMSEATSRWFINGSNEHFIETQSNNVTQLEQHFNNASIRRCSVPTR